MSPSSLDVPQWQQPKVFTAEKNVSDHFPAYWLYIHSAAVNLPGCWSVPADSATNRFHSITEHYMPLQESVIFYFLFFASAAVNTCRTIRHALCTYTNLTFAVLFPLTRLAPPQWFRKRARIDDSRLENSVVAQERRSTVRRYADVHLKPHMGEQPEYARFEKDLIRHVLLD